MLTPAAILLLASYVGPTASPDAELGTDPNAAPSTYQAGTGIERKDTERAQPKKQTIDDDLNPADDALSKSEPEKAEEGHMVVPPGLQ